jgi:hypothetical protein
MEFLSPHTISYIILLNDFLALNKGVETKTDYMTYLSEKIMVNFNFFLSTNIKKKNKIN